MLFCGTGSVERQFSNQFQGCEVVSVDIQNRWKPTHCENILHWDYRQFSPKHVDVIWASPPCTEDSQAKTVGIRNLRGADRQVRRTLDVLGDEHNKPETQVKGPKTAKYKSNYKVQL